MINKTIATIIILSCFFLEAEANSLNWGTCQGIKDNEFQCTTLDVPLNYKHPNAGTTSIAVMQYTKTGTQPSQVLFFNDGGPWGDDTNDLPKYVPFLDPSITNKYTIVTFDPRGVGGSQNLACQTPLNGQIANANAETDTGVSNLINLYEQKWSACTSQYNGFQNDIGTNNTVQDMDSIRQAFGVNQISYLGYSYGTQLGSLYLSLYGNHVQRMILDSNMLPERDFQTIDMDVGAAYENTLTNFFTQCDQNPQCPIYPNAAAAYDQAMRILSNRSVPTKYGLPLNLTRFLTGVEVSLPWTNSNSQSINPVIFAPDLWADYLAKGIANINQKNNGSLLMKLFMINSGYNTKTKQYEGDNSLYDAVVCADFDNHLNPSEIMEDAVYAQGQYPRIGGFVASTLLPICSGWLRTANNLPLPTLNYTGNTPPVLLVCNQHDPETPLSWCKSLAATIPNSIVVTWTGAGHGVYLSNEPPGTCVKNYVNNYLLQGTLPQNGTVCNDTFNPTTPSNS